MRRNVKLAAAALSVAMLGCQKRSLEEEQMRVEAENIDRVLAEADALLLDVREPEEIRELGTLVGYLNIPIDQLESRLDEIPRDKTILTA